MNKDAVDLKDQQDKLADVAGSLSVDLRHARLTEEAERVLRSKLIIYCQQLILKASESAQNSNLDIVSSGDIEEAFTKIGRKARKDDALQLISVVAASCGGLLGLASVIKIKRLDLFDASPFAGAVLVTASLVLSLLLAAAALRVKRR